MSIYLPLGHRGPNKDKKGYAVIDGCDAHLADWCWSVNKEGYVGRWQTFADRPRKWIYLHRTIMGCTDGDGAQVDHVNGDKRDHRRANLDLTDASGNGANRTKLNSNNRSGHRNVSFDKRSMRWVVRLMKNRKHVGGGSYRTLGEAIEAAASLRKTHFGQA